MNHSSSFQYSYRLSHVVAALFLIRLIQFAIVYMTPFQFDTSTSIFINKYVDETSTILYPQSVITVLNNLMSWDSVYFLKMSMEGITFEHEWVFVPLWWRSMNYIKQTFDLNLYDILVLFIVVNNILIIFVSKLIYLLSLEICKSNMKVIPKDFNTSRFAYISSLVILIQPSGIFSTVSYGETPVQFLCYLALYCYLTSTSLTIISNKYTYLLSGTLFTIAFGIRSNSILYGLIYIYDLSRYHKLSDILCILVTGSQLFFGFVLATYIPYSIYCPERGEWCNTYTKSLVSYAQSHYWNVGFFRYFTPGNIPLFIIALPQLLIIGLSIREFQKWKSVRPVAWVSIVYWILQFTLMHVQIVNRISTFLPIHIWYVSYLYCNNNKFAKIILRWWIVWVFLQTALFSAFLPPA